MSVTDVRTPESTKSASRATSSSARRKAARSASARRRPPSRPRSSSATATSSRFAQLEVLREAEDAAGGDERELLYRLRKTCESGIVAAELAAREDELENRTLAARVSWRGDELPLRSAQAKLAVLPGYGDRDELGSLANAESARFNDDRRELLAAGEALEAELSGEPDAIARNAEEKGISLHELERALDAAARASAAVYATHARALVRQAARPRARGRADLEPHELPAPALAARAHVHEGARRRGLRRHAERARPRHREHAGIRLDLDDRPQKSPRACVIASDPPNLVHLITRAQGGLHDYQAFLHEAGHALHYAGCDPALPYTFRKLSRDHALTEIYSYIVEAISREPGWHAEHFGLSDEEAAENAEATVFLEALLFRRYTAKLQFELEFWGRFARRRRHAGRLLRAADRGDGHPLPEPRTTSRTWTRASTRRTTCAPGSARRSCASP